MCKTIIISIALFDTITFSVSFHESHLRQIHHQSFKSRGNFRLEREHIHIIINTQKCLLPILSFQYSHETIIFTRQIFQFAHFIHIKINRRVYTIILGDFHHPLAIIQSRITLIQLLLVISFGIITDIFHLDIRLKTSILLETFDIAQLTFREAIPQKSIFIQHVGISGNCQIPFHLGHDFLTIRSQGIYFSPRSIIITHECRSRTQIPNRHSNQYRREIPRSTNEPTFFLTYHGQPDYSKSQKQNDNNQKVNYIFATKQTVDKFT